MTNFSFLTRIAPEHVAVLQEFTRSVPVKVGALAEKLGLRVVVAPLPMNISGSIQPSSEGGSYVIKVNRFEPKERQRFTIAHEIAHYLLHEDRIRAGLVDSILYRSKLSSQAEAEANRLAADILMPRDKVEEAVANGDVGDGPDRVAELAQLFDVSRQAMEIRTG